MLASYFCYFCYFSVTEFCRVHLPLPKFPSSQVPLSAIHVPSCVRCSVFFDSGSATIPNRRYLRLLTVAVDVRHHIQRVFAESRRFIVVHPLIFLHYPAFFHFHPHFHYSSAFIVNLSSTALPSSFVVQLQRSESVVCVLYPTAFICQKLLHFLLTHGFIVPFKAIDFAVFIIPAHLCIAALVFSSVV